MSEFTILIITICLFVFSFLALLWVLAFTEFSYLGSKGIKGLYDLFSGIYEWKWIEKEYRSPEITENLFLRPIREILEHKTNVQVLDLACGSGRMSLMLLDQNWFEGQIKAIDLSDGMLKKFKQSLEKTLGKIDKVSIEKMNLADWPSQENETGEDEKYDLVTMMEVGEFLPNFIQIVKQAAKAIKPKGLFLLTKPPDYMSMAYPGRKQSKAELKGLLTNCGFQKVEIIPWTSRYEVVYAWKF
ncbi:MAG: class I SAM-dependent methyltransferase [Candidatus Melainabacteria bacterium]|jgi:SAM-dependent methyltransferase